MDRELIIKLLGKNNEVILGDQIFNLIEILELLRVVIIKNKDISSEELSIVENRLIKINDFIFPLKASLENDSIAGYTNSKLFLAKYIGDINFNINNLIQSFNPFDRKTFTLYTNTLMDLALKYN